MKEIILDKEDEERVHPHKWWQSKSGSRITGKVESGLKNLGRYVLGYEGPLIVDHINRDIYDNRKENLRLVTMEQSLWNRGPRKDAKHSKYKGVTIRYGRWVAQLRKQGKCHRIIAKSEIEAAIKYNELAKLHHGEYAYLNQILDAQA